MKVRLQIVLGILLLFACSDFDQNTHSNLVINETIDSVLSYTMKDLKNNSVLVHSEYYPNELKIGTIHDILQSKEFTNEDEREVIQGLLALTQDTVKFKFSEFHHKGNGLEITVFEDTNDPLFYLDSLYAGSINISDASCNSNFACYYFAYNCGNHCSRGYFISARKNQQGWTIDRIIPVWHG